MKKFSQLSIGALALFGASSLMITDEADSYATLGFSLGTGQRDFRLNNNFADGAANNNTTADPNWPGYDGAELAIWKSAAEWGSDAFGDGSGDPTQNKIGNGGANFNPVWNGNAQGHGTGRNIISAINGSGGGAIAWMYVGSSGWTIEFLDDDFTFSDGPGSIGGSQMCIQAINTHEYGHALGLDHSNVRGATMWPSASYGSTGPRSINSDDQAGVQAIYGVMDANMPYIDDIQGSTAAGGTAIVIGGNYTADRCRIWFNSDVLNNQQSGGEPYKLGSLTSTNGGTQISFTVPTSGIETGGIHVKLDGGGESLSEGHPFELGSSPWNKLNLTGPTSANAGTTVNYSFTNATNNVPYKVFYSFSNAGTTVNGHEFDIGSPATEFAAGNTGAGGSGSASAFLPAGASGVTAYIEAVTILGGGAFEDSNMITLVVN